MILFSLLIISIIALSLIRFSIYEYVAPVAEKTHVICLELLPSSSNSLSELKALVCAENFDTLNSSQLYVSSGLIHLFVVSGAHLIVIEKILTKLKFKSIITYLILIVYGFACNLNAPVTRCLVAYTLTYYLTKKHISWPAHFKLLIIGAVTLCLNPAWIGSLSLQMSWIAAFLVIAGDNFFKNSSQLFRQSLFFFTLLPTIIFFQIPAPTVIIANLVLAPILELVLFPLGLLVLFFNFLEPLFEYLIFIFKIVLTGLEFDFQFQTAEMPKSIVLTNWLIIFLIHFIFHLVHVHQKRKFT